jgi:CubicO group peptidase (beta-lactamase class C family)
MAAAASLLAALILAPLLTQASSAGEQPLAALDSIVQQGLSDQRYPGAVLIVGHKGKRVWQRAYGRHTYAPDSPPVTLDTIYDLASLTKVVATTPAALLLAEEGRLDLNERVARYAPAFAVNGKEQVTVADLLTHVSGLKAYETWSVVDKKRPPDQEPAEALRAHYAGLPASYVPRTKVVYSCLNMQMLAGILEENAAMPLEELLRARLWGPLGMRDTTYRPSDKQRTRCAPSFSDAEGRPVRGVVHDPLARYHGAAKACPGNAGLFSTAPDLAAYAEAILNNGRHRGRQVLRPESVAQMLTRKTPDEISTPRTIGWAVYGEPPWQPGPRPLDRCTIGHTGYTGTWIWIDHASKTYIVFLSNRTYPSPATGGKEGGSIDSIRKRICAAVVESLGLSAAVGSAGRRNAHREEESS